MKKNEREKKFSLSKKKEIYLLCDVFSIRPEDYKAGFRDKKKQSSILRHRFRQFYHYWIYIYTQFSLVNIYYHQTYLWDWTFFQFCFAYSFFFLDRGERRFLFEAKKTLKMSFFHLPLSLVCFEKRQTSPSRTTTTTTTWHSTLAFSQPLSIPRPPIFFSNHLLSVFFFFFSLSRSSFSYNVLWIIDYRRL